MTTTNDKVVLSAEVTGAEQFKALDEKLKSIEASSKKTSDAMNQVQGGVRNVAYQVQDLAVQIAGGTSAFVALGQQLPQLLSGFGTAGIVIGAVAAVAIPALQAGLKAAGVEMRTLKQMTDDAEQSTKAFQESLRATQLSTLELTLKYGQLAPAAEKYFKAQNEFDKQVAFSNLNVSIAELQSRLSDFTEQTDKAFKGMRGDMGGISGDVFDIGKAFAAWRLDVTQEQAAEIAKRFKSIDPKDQKAVAEAWLSITDYIIQSNTEQSKWNDQSKGLLGTIRQQAQAWLIVNENINAAIEKAAIYNTVSLNNQLDFIGKIGNAQRANNQYLVADLTAQEKLKEIENERTRLRDEKKLTANIELELTAKENLIKSQSLEKQKDFTKAQYESYNAQILTTNNKILQLNLDGRIADLQASQIDGLNYESTLEEKKLKNIFDQQIAYAAIDEMRRKNLINAQQALELEQHADEIRSKADENSIKSIQRIALDNERNVRLQVEGITMQNIEKSRAFALEKEIFGLSTLQQEARRKENDILSAQAKSVASIKNDTKLSDDEKIDALGRINEEYKVQLNLAKQEAKYRQDMNESMGMGAADRIKTIAESFSAFKMGGMVADSVFNNMSSAIDNFVETGKFKFGDFARSIIFDLEKMALKAAVLGVFKSMGVMDFLGIPGKAVGGPVDQGSPYIVGEQGPELFVPKSAGTIIPNGKGLGSGAGNTINNYNYSISAVDAKSVAQLFYENRRTLFGTVEQAKKEMPFRQGAMA